MTTGNQGYDEAAERCMANLGLSADNNETIGWELHNLQPDNSLVIVPECPECEHAHYIGAQSTDNVSATAETNGNTLVYICEDEQVTVTLI